MSGVKNSSRSCGFGFEKKYGKTKPVKIWLLLRFPVFFLKLKTTTLTWILTPFVFPDFLYIQIFDVLTQFWTKIKFEPTVKKRWSNQGKQSFWGISSLNVQNCYLKCRFFKAFVLSHYGINNTGDAWAWEKVFLYLTSQFFVWAFKASSLLPWPLLHSIAVSYHPIPLAFSF